MSERHEPPANGEPYERSDARPRAILEYGAGLVVLVVAALVVMAWLYTFLSQREQRLDRTASPLAEGPSAPQGPRLQANPSIDLKTLRDQEKARLESYGWVDKDLGVVHIPIDKATDVILQRGLPTRQSAESQR